MIRGHAGDSLNHTMNSGPRPSATIDRLALLASVYGVGCVDLRAPGAVDGDSIGLLDVDLCRRFGVLAVAHSGDSVTVAMTDPSDAQALAAIERALPGRIVRRRAAIGTEILRVLNTWPETASASRGVIKRLVEPAIAARASDIFIDRRGETLIVNWRVDGELKSAPLPDDFADDWPREIRRQFGPPAPPMALGMGDGSENWRGAGEVVVDGRHIPLRVTMAAFAGSLAVAIRLHDRAELVGLDGGFDATDRAGLAAVRDAALASGPRVMLVAGSPGAGKTTTWAAVLNGVAARGKRVVTVERPAEIPLRGVHQMSLPMLGPNAGPDAASHAALAAGIEQAMLVAPDVLGIGELATAGDIRLAFEVARRGVPVIATLSAGDSDAAFEAVRAAVGDAAMLATGWGGVFAQKLLPALCPYCRTLQRLSANVRRQVRARAPVWDGGETFVAPGCGRCAHSGRLGRTAIAEWLVHGDAVAPFIGRGVASAGLRQLGAAVAWARFSASGLRALGRGRIALDTWLSL